MANPKTNSKVATLLAVMGDETRPVQERIAAAELAAPFCHEIPPPIIVHTSDDDVDVAEWLRRARDTEVV